MIDKTTNKPIRVSKDGESDPYLLVPLSQLDSVESLFKENNISYWVDQDAISLDGDPYIAFINFGRDADTRAIQEILDGKINSAKGSLRGSQRRD